MNMQQDPQLRKKNIRTAVILGVIAVVVMLRILWKLSSRNPDQEPGTRLEHLAARVGHLALYAVMVVMPITGYLGTGVATEYFFMFDIASFKDTEYFLMNYAMSFFFG